jgi:hypothetical protein
MVGANLDVFSLDAEDTANRRASAVAACALEARALFCGGASGAKACPGASPAESRAIRADASWLNGIGLHGAWGSSDSEELLLAKRGSLQTKKPQTQLRHGTFVEQGLPLRTVS